MAALKSTLKPLRLLRPLRPLLNPTRTYSTAPPQHWLPTQTTRVGKCMFHGASPSEVASASIALHELATNWRGLLLGYEGFLGTADHANTDIGRDARGEVDAELVERVARTGEGWAGIARRRVAWGDQDIFGHVNNTKYLFYAETSRMNYFLRIAEHLGPGGNGEVEEARKMLRGVVQPGSRFGLIMKTADIDFKFAMRYPEYMSTFHRVLAVKSHSIELESLILSETHKRPAARIFEDIVTYDYSTNRKIEVPGWLRDVMEDVMRMQEEEKVFWKGRRQDVEELVEEVEGCLRRMELGV